jgi:hypothetical protein
MLRQGAKGSVKVDEGFRSVHGKVLDQWLVSMTALHLSTSDPKRGAPHPRLRITYGRPPRDELSEGFCQRVAGNLRASRRKPESPPQFPMLLAVHRLDRRPPAGTDVRLHLRILHPPDTGRKQAGSLTASMNVMKAAHLQRAQDRAEALPLGLVSLTAAE